MPDEAENNTDKTEKDSGELVGDRPLLPPWVEVIRKRFRELEDAGVIEKIRSQMEQQA